MGEILEAALGGHLHDFQAGVGEQVQGVVEPLGVDELEGRGVIVLFELPAQVLFGTVGQGQETGAALPGSSRWNASGPRRRPASPGWRGGPSPR